MDSASGLTGGRGAAERPTVFVRKASGVVKAFSTFDAFAYNSIANSPISMGATALMLMLIAFPSGNPALAALIGGAFIALACVAYSMLQAAMPRTGGDYVFQSRTLSGAVGFIITFAAYVFLAGLWLAMNGWMFGNIIVGPFLMVLGSYWNVPVLKDLATWLVSAGGVFWGNIIVIAWIVAMCSLGFTFYAKIQKWFFWGGLAAFAIMLAFVALNSQETFVGNFNSFMSQYFGVSEAYQSTIANAKAAGFVPGSGFSLGDTVALVPGAFFILMWAVWAAGNAGEIRDKGTVSSKLWQTLGALGLTTGIVVAMFYLISSRFGIEFLGSASWLYYNAADQSLLPVPPFFGFFIMALSTNPIILILMFLCFFLWYWMALPNAMIYATRVVLGMSLDRAVPAWIGRVNSRTHTPLNAVLAIGFIAVLFGALYAFTDWFWKLTLSGSLLTLISYAATCFGAAIWPYVKPDLFKASPISKYVWAGIPVITIVGLLFDVIAVYILWQYVTVATWGIAAVTGYVFNLAMLAIGAITYFAFKAYRKKKESLDLSLVYREIPPE